MKISISAMILLLAAATMANAHTISFVNLPFVEGTLFVAIKDGDKTIAAKAVIVENDHIEIQSDLSSLKGKNIFIQAFQDLNDNRNLDFGNFGRPAEPYLQTDILVGDSTEMIVLELKQ